MRQHLFPIVLLLVLLSTGCYLPTPRPAPSPQEQVQAVSPDDHSRLAFSEGLEAFTAGDNSILKRLADNEPDTIWGQASGQLLRQAALQQEQQEKMQILGQQISSLKQTLRDTSNKLKNAQDKNHALQNKLTELTKVLVDLEKHAR